MKFYRRGLWLLAAVFGAFPPAAMASEFPLPPQGSNMVGQLQVVIARHRDTLLDIARHFDVGYNEIRAANPGVDPWLPGRGTHVLVPTRYILPPVPWRGIVIDIPARRLFYFPPGQKVVYTYPVGIFRPKWPDPLGATSIIAKVRDPSWTVPKNIQAEHARDGDPIPAYFPPGADNPMGELALQTGWSQIYIHGTNKPWGVGMRVSHGCFHVYPENEVHLFAMVKVGTPVRTINAPFLVGTDGEGHLYLQGFRPLKAYSHGVTPEQDAVDAISGYEAASHKHWVVNWQQVINLVSRPNAVPTPVDIHAPNLQDLVAGVPPEPYLYAPYGANANTAAPPGEPVRLRTG